MGLTRRRFVALAALVAASAAAAGAWSRRRGLAGWAAAYLDDRPDTAARCRVGAQAAGPRPPRGRDVPGPLAARDLDTLLAAARTLLGAPLTTALYAEAYRICDNYDERVRQIDLVHQIGSRLDGVVRSPLTRAMLAVSKGPARKAGWGELTDFLENGYRVFKHMRGARHFLDTVRERERRILDRIYANDPDPFGFDESVS